MLWLCKREERFSLGSTALPPRQNYLHGIKEGLKKKEKVQVCHKVAKEKQLDSPSSPCLFCPFQVVLLGLRQLL